MGEALSLVTKGKAPVSRSVSLRTRRGDGCEEMAEKGDGTLLEANPGGSKSAFTLKV